MRIERKIKNILSLILLFSILISSVSAAVLSMDNVDIRSNYFDFEKAWIINFVADDYSTDTLTGSFNKDDFGDNEPKQSLSVRANVQPTYCTWSLREDTSTNPDVYTYDPIVETFWFWEDEERLNFLNNVCAEFDSTNLYVQKSFGDTYYKIWCLKVDEKIATVGNFQTQIKAADTIWEVTAQGKTTEKATIGNSDTGNGRNSKVGENVWVKWLGQADTGEDCPETEDAKPFHSNSFSNGWSIGYEGNYDSYRGTVSRSNIENLLYQWATAQRTESSLKILLDDSAQNSISSNPFSGYSILDKTIGAGKIKVDLDRVIVFPQFQLIIDTDYLELNIPVGEPKIVSVSDVEFNEGDSGRVEVRIRNDADEGEGGFTTRIIECSSEFSSNTPPIGSRLDGGEEETLTFEIIGSSTGEDGDVTGSCTVEMKEGTSGEIDTETFDIKMSQIRECPPPELTCGVDSGRQVVKECNDEGTGFEIKEVCDEDEICDINSGGAECIKKEGSGDGDESGNGLFDLLRNFFNKIKEWLGGGLGNALETLYLIVSLVAGLVTLFVTKETLSGIRGLRDNKSARWIISIIASLGVSVVIFQFVGSLAFYISLAILLIYFFISSKIKKGLRKI